MHIQNLHRSKPTLKQGAFIINSLKENQGFTLLELLVVLIIMVLGFSAISISLSSSNDTSELKATARDMASALRRTKNCAQINHKEEFLTIDFAENNYTVSCQSKVFNIPQSIDTTIHTGQKDLVKAEGKGRIRFFPDGSASGGWVKLERNKHAWRIDINWLTGQIELNDVVQ